MRWYEIIEDVVFDQFGDFTLTKTDISTTTKSIDILKQNVIDRVKSIHGDYSLQKQYGGNISKLIGLTNSTEIELKARNNLIYCLTSDGFIDKSNLNIFVKKLVDKLLIKLEISVAGEGAPLAMAFIFALNRTFIYAV